MPKRPRVAEEKPPEPTLKECLSELHEDLDTIYPLVTALELPYTLEDLLSLYDLFDGLDAIEIQEALPAAKDIVMKFRPNDSGLPTLADVLAVLGRVTSSDEDKDEE